MSSRFLDTIDDSPQATIRMLQRELAETNREVLGLTVELEKRVEERTAALQAIQQELQEKNLRLEAANSELEAFSYSVSHDLRAPLRHLQGFAEAFREDCQGSLDDQGREYLEHITRAAREMGELLEALLR